MRSKHASSKYFSIFIIQIIEDCKEFKMNRKGKDIRKKIHPIFKLPYFWGENEKFPTAAF
jgi:hypothetical protein